MRTIFLLTLRLSISIFALFGVCFTTSYSQTIAQNDTITRYDLLSVYLKHVENIITGKYDAKAAAQFGKLANIYDVPYTYELSWLPVNVLRQYCSRRIFFPSDSLTMITDERSTETIVDSTVIHSTTPILEMLATSYSIYRARICFQSIDFSFDEMDNFTDAENKLIDKVMSRMLKKVSDDIYLKSWSSNKISATLGYSELDIIFNDKIGRGERYENAIANLSGLKEWMIQETTFYTTLLNNYLSNYGKVFGYQNMRWGISIPEVKKILKKYDSFDSTRSTITKYDAIASIDVGIDYEFLDDKLYSIDMTFIKSINTDEKGKKRYLISWDKENAQRVFKELSGLLFGKYGLCKNRFNIENSNSTQQYKRGNLKRQNEIVWDLGLTIMVLSLDYENEIFYIYLNYFSSDYFSKRKDSWKNKL